MKRVALLLTLISSFVLGCGASADDRGDTPSISALTVSPELVVYAVDARGNVSNRLSGVVHAL
jgi:hypothetical protein